jgi:hypothetical protein
MYGGGVDRDIPEHLDSDVLPIPSFEADTFKEKLLPVLTAKVVVVLEKDTLFNRVIQEEFIRENKD